MNLAHKPLRWILLCFGLLVCAPLAFADIDLDFASDPFFSDTVVNRHNTWHLRLGGGAAFFASHYKGHIPPITGTFIVDGGRYYLFAQGVVSVPLDVIPQSAGEFEGSLARDVTHNLSLGLMGGSSTGHNAGVGLAEAYPGVVFTYYGPGKPFAVEFRYELRASKIMPMVQYGPHIDFEYGQLRPYVMAAAGVYQVAETVYVVLAENTEEASGMTHYYAGAATGFGVNYIFRKNYSIALEGRYERVFSPGQPLAFWVPTVHFGYLF